MEILIKLLTLLFFVGQIYCHCNICQATNNVACHSENLFSLCIDGKATEDFITCPENYVCTADREVCYPLPEATPSCIREQMSDENFCNVCSENKVFACLNETTIAFCMGNETPMEDVVSYCPENTVCDINSTQGYCSDVTLAKPSCVSDSNEPPTTTEEPITTTEPTPTTFDPEVFCINKATTGSFKHESDVSCKTFVLCYEMGGEIHGLIRTCTADTYFDSDQRFCVSEKPKGCH